MEYKDAIREQWGRLAERYGRPLSPAALVRRAVRAARREARSWGEAYRKEAPTVYEAHVSVQDWLSYYGKRTEAVSERAAETLERRLRDEGFSLGEAVTVTIEADPSVAFGGVRVAARFCEESAGCCVARAGAEAPPTPISSEEAARLLKTQPYPDSSGEDGRANPPRTAPMPKRDAEAYLVDEEGRRYRVNPGSTIGVIRRKNDPVIPAIPLPIERYGAVSQNQGAFACKANAWSFLHSGRNSTVIRNSTGKTTLTAGDECALDEGAVMIFASGAPLVFHTA